MRPSTSVVRVACVFAVLLIACKRDAQPQRTRERSATANAITSAPSASTAPSASAFASAVASAVSSASASAPARVVCGAATCAPNQFCLHYNGNGGGAYSPNKQPVDSTMCADTIPHSDGMRCGPPDAARQSSCSALIPRAAPHGGGGAPMF